MTAEMKKNTGLHCQACGAAAGHPYTVDCPEGGLAIAADRTIAMLASLDLDAGKNCAWSYEACYRAMLAAAPGIAQPTAPSEALIALLRDAFDALEGTADSDVDHFENDDEEREGARVQYAVRKVMEAIDTLTALAPFRAEPEPA